MGYYTLEKSAKPRIEEWKIYSRTSEWHVEVIFVAHEFNAEIPEEINIDGVKFNISFVSYYDLWDQTKGMFVGRVLNQYLLPPLAENKTPSFVRQAFLELLG